MTGRMQKYRLQKEIEGMVQLRVWIPKEHEDFFKELAKQARPGKPLKVIERYGRKATQRQIDLAESLARIKGKEPPKHLYDYHLSLSAWVRGNSGN